MNVTCTMCLYILHFEQLAFYMSSRAHTQAKQTSTFVHVRCCCCSCCRCLCCCCWWWLAGVVDLNVMRGTNIRQGNHHHRHHHHPIAAHREIDRAQSWRRVEVESSRAHTHSIYCRCHVGGIVSGLYSCYMCSLTVNIMLEVHIVPGRPQPLARHRHHRRCRLCFCFHGSQLCCSTFSRLFLL